MSEAADRPDADTAEPADAIEAPSAAGSALRAAALLGVFTVVFTALMALTQDATREPIRASVEARRLELIAQVLPRADYDNALLEDTVTLPVLPALGLTEPVTVHRARLGGAPVALVFEAQAPDGYSGAIRLLMALRADGTLAGVRVVAHRETPGLGDYIDPAKDRANPKWIAQFAGRDSSDGTRWTVRKDGGDFTYMTGATISARAVTRAAGRAAAALAPMSDVLFALPAGSSAEAAFR
ncbi:RnfABCDGE type electron transport complex subunit G [Methyloversatilis universalis]|uniref:RnfABCDGE type electron transport complex subunit G n=1 Tax=Methyloversatilis universalis TaxID=378211 RepID=UPI0003693168|nr:RnfABCDGE type electron transport complex subunit G [Methyloversatilis universalis]